MGISQQVMNIQQICPKIQNFIRKKLWKYYLISATKTKVIEPLSTMFQVMAYFSFEPILCYHQLDVGHFVLAFLCGKRINSVLHSQYHGCWCPGSLRRQDISTNDIVVLHEEGFQIPVSFQCEGVISIVDTFLCFLWTIQHVKG